MTDPREPNLPVNLSATGPPETILAPEPVDALEALAAALAMDDPTIRREAGPDAGAAPPRCRGGLAREDGGAYACFRVGYHRGLDRLRQSGWRGNGYVRWRHETNRGFLRALDGLRSAGAGSGGADGGGR